MKYDLINELQKYKPNDLSEQKEVIETLHFLKTTKKPYDRTNTMGHVTAGALVVDGLGKVLLNHHKICNMWFQFGGHSDGNSNSLEVALREVEEESQIKDYHVFGGIFDVSVQYIEPYAKKHEDEHYHYDINYLVVTHNYYCVPSNESSEIKWFTLSQAKQMITKTDLVSVRLLDKYEKLLSSGAFNK